MKITKVEHLYFLDSDNVIISKYFDLALITYLNVSSI